MKKQKLAEEYFYEEYSEICKELYIDYMKGLKERLNKEGKSHLLLMKNNPIVEKILCTYVKDIFLKYESSIITTLETIGNELETNMTEKFIKNFEEKNNKNIEGHFKGIKDKIEEIIGMEMQETTKSNLNNIKENIKQEIIKNIKKKNKSIERLLKKEKNKNGIGNIIKNSTIESIINWVVPFIVGVFIGKIDKIISIIKTLISNN